MSLHFHPLTVRRVAAETDEGLVVSFDVPEHLRDTFQFTPGQYLTLRQSVDGEELRRSYSICVGPGEEALRIGIRKVPGGLFSGWADRHLKAGDTLEVIPPQGRFTMPAATGGRPRHVLGIAAGSGITPILSIIKAVLNSEPDSRFTLIYGNRRLASTMFLEELEDLKNRHLTRLAVHHVFSREHLDQPLYTGRLTAAKVAEFLQPPATDSSRPIRALIDPASVDLAFVCGPHGVNEEVATALHEAGIDPARIHVERFGVPTGPAGGVDGAPRGAIPTAQAGDAAHAVITVIRDGVRREIDYRLTADGKAPSILEQAGAAGLELPFSCKSGVCCTCRARVLEGEVRMDRNFALDKDEVKAGFVLSCQSHPLSARVVLSFDER